MTQYFIFETLTGTILQEIFPYKASWQSTLNKAEKLDIELPLDQPDVSSRLLGEVTAERLRIIREAEAEGRVIRSDVPPTPEVVATNEVEDPSFEKNGLTVELPPGGWLSPDRVSGDDVEANFKNGELTLTWGDALPFPDTFYPDQLYPGEE